MTDKMKTRRAIAGVLLASLTALVACDGASAEAAQERRMVRVEVAQGRRMVRVEHTAYGDILCDSRTGVVYFAYNHGGRMETYSGVCVMVDQNGKPLVMGEKND